MDMTLFTLLLKWDHFLQTGDMQRSVLTSVFLLTKKKKTPVPDKNSNKNNYLTLEYSKTESGILGRVTIPDEVSIKIRFYTPWGKVIRYKESNKQISSGKGKFLFLPVGLPINIKEKTEKHLDISVNKEKGRFYFFAGFKKINITKNKIDQLLKIRAQEYNSGNPVILGEWSGIAASITNNISWMRLYQPDKKRVYIPAGRRWIFPGPDGKKDLWTIFEWDAFFNAALASVYDNELAGDEIAAVIDTQYPWGNIPNWRTDRGGTPDRSQPPVGAFVVLKVYLKSKNKDILRSSYNALKKWHLFWIAKTGKNKIRRDGNLDGLLEWGSDKDKLYSGMPKWEIGATGRQRGAWESGEDDLPNFDNIPFDDNKGTLMMNCIDLSSLYLLDAESMERIAVILGHKKDAEYFSKKRKQLKNKINKILWNKDFYYDRFWNGKFSTHKAASNFYPLIAGAPDKKMAEKVIKHLLSEKEFWGEYVIPTISRDNPAFKDQQYWRGTIWPPTNYLVYKGLKRFSYDEIAADFAIKSATLFNNSWKKLGLCRENYNSITGEGGGHRYQSWGPLFALILLEDFIDISPFHGFCIGNLAASKQNRINNIKIQGHLYDLTAKKESLLLKRDKKNMIKLSGRAVLKNIIITDKSIGFDINVVSDNTEIYPVIFGTGSYNVKIDGKELVNQKLKTEIPGGKHKIYFRKRERK